MHTIQCPQLGSVTKPTYEISVEHESNGIMGTQHQQTTKSNLTHGILKNLLFCQ